MNEMKSRALWSDDKTIEDLEFCVYTNGADCVIYNLHEDLVCLKERIAELERERDDYRAAFTIATHKNRETNEHADAVLQAYKLNQQAKGVSDAVKLFSVKTLEGSRCWSSALITHAEQLRKGGE